MKPNIFDISSKELTQDAFITWLIKWAHPGLFKIDSELNRCGLELLQLMVRQTYPNVNLKINELIVERQWRSIDIIVVINRDYFVAIEDKIFAGEHSNQLDIYKKIAEEYCLNENRKLILIYLKTGIESIKTFNAVKEKGFNIIDRTILLNLLSKYKKIENNIFKDFLEKIVRLDQSYKAYKTKKILDWKSFQWIGFYQDLEKCNIALNWHFVNNASKGFWNLLLSWDLYNGVPLYIQIEEGRVAFKISTHPEDIMIDEESINRSQLRNQYSRIVIQKANENGLKEIKRPGRFGKGVWMTVAIIEQSDWMIQQEGLINYDKTCENLISYQNFLKNIIESSITSE